MKSFPMNQSRRLFLKQASAMASLGAGAPLAMNLAALGSASAATAGGSGYKALVCIFLAGGNDAYNTVLATDTASWSAYTTTRNQLPTSIALARNSLHDLAPQNTLAGARSIALHPQLRGVQSLFNDQRRLAIISNVGPLQEPLSKQDYTASTKRVPSKLFSHNDQQATWQALAPEGGSLGWGGRLADAVAGSNGKSLFTGISTAGNAVWVSGQQVKQYQIQSSGVIRLGVQTGSNGADQVFGSAQVAAALQRIAQTSNRGHAMEADLASVAQRSIQADQDLRLRLPAASDANYGGTAAMMYTQPATGGQALNPLAQQLQTVARCIATRNELGMQRQVFFVSIGGFDTHDEQLGRHADLMARLDHALTYFDRTLNSMGLSDSVTTFTASDFGRTFTSNGDGTDHGWGGHHFVMGGAVQGGTVVGELPTYALKNLKNNNFDGSPDQLTNGALLPKISVEQYGATLGQWFGAPSDVINTVFPNFRNFGGALPLMRA